jgi:hypothetical protein
MSSDLEILTTLLDHDWFMRAYSLQVQTQRLFHRMAGFIGGQAYPMAPLSDPQTRIERNFFSTLFLVVIDRMAEGSPHLPLYAMVNQAMRVWVTSCDNILDDEYKEVLPFAFPGQGGRMRSVLGLLIADRVLTEYIADHHADQEILRKAGRVSLAALASSALQECEEEARPVPVLSSQTILAEVHQRKTGDLFRAPLALPEALEAIPAGRIQAAHLAAEQFGLACQVLDDIKDVAIDVRSGRHNLLVSLAFETGALAEPTLAELRLDSAAWEAWDRFPGLAAAAWGLAEERFVRSFQALEELGIGLSGDERAGIVSLMGRLLGVPRLSVNREAAA